MVGKSENEKTGHSLCSHFRHRGNTSTETTQGKSVTLGDISKSEPHVKNLGRNLPGNVARPGKSTDNSKSMVIHSGSFLLLFAYVLSLITAIGLLTAVGMLVARKFRTAANVAGASISALAFYFAAASMISWVSPQRVIKLGDSYCWDLWCLGIQKVSATPQGREMVYKIDVRFFSDANTVKTGIDDTRVYL